MRGYPIKAYNFCRIKLLNVRFNLAFAPYNAS
ncbi:hypothetical protein PBAL39_16459 [Pedobacter sp. BAL39]|nr:hypothetical protein PBAL39_16459 [Pedobacter sp. BAL39]